ncbi:carotenoid biosynthesis protein [Pontibacter burrus]|uniref:Carotenoid biosynthesis protein n=1 Tax=Pontibacter burrus TaxID=2704466 RepID=A0A6B3LQE8_9BACT|nr:carotenoid biosynthesis protein [Pontibacter burrus]NEM96426.1 carotenoid biosynthesis protein [Pontibacter burrus]
MIRSLTEEAPRIVTPPQRRISFWAALLVIVIFHAVGFWGLQFSGRPTYFQELTPLNLLLTNVLLFSLHRHWNWPFIAFAVTTVVVGFLAEVLGIHTGLLFGNYNYGAALGLKLWDVPLLIGLNWLLLVYTTGTIVNRLSQNLLIKAAAGAGLMVLYDFFMEPVAMQYDFWSWQNDQIPLSNYLGWLGLAFVLQLFFHRTDTWKQNPLAPWVYVVQLLFFIGLYLFLVM